MSDYVQTTFFAPKDALVTGNPAKKIKGAEIDPELSAISTAVATKFDSADVADNAAADAAASDATLMTPLKTKRLLENATYTIAYARYSVSLLANDGSGSGLDADLLDGVQGASYLQTANLLTALTAVDGAGSGVDAD